MKTELEYYKFIGHRLPKLPFFSGIVNRGLKPLYNRKVRDLVISDVLGRKMELNPAECVDGNLLFCPQLYDYIEIDFLLNNLDSNDVFVDVGSHIGFYSLVASKKTNDILAIEASPYTYNRLKKNIELNNLNISILNCGVSDKNEKLNLSQNNSNNAGGQNFMQNNKEGIQVQCYPLDEIINNTDFKSIKIMKFDVEGYEYKILKRFLENIDKKLYPKYIITEFFGEDVVNKTTGNQIELLLKYGYRKILDCKENQILQLM